MVAKFLRDFLLESGKEFKTPIKRADFVGVGCFFSGFSIFLGEREKTHLSLQNLSLQPPKLQSCFQTPQNSLEVNIFPTL